jgi:hypothetical protein
MKKTKTLLIVSLVGVVCLGSCGEGTSISPEEAEAKATAIKEKENSSDFVQPSKFTLNINYEGRASSANNSGNALSEKSNTKILFDADSHYYYLEMYNNTNRSHLTSMMESSRKEIMYLDGMNLISKISNNGEDYTIGSSLSANEELAIDAFNKSAALYLYSVYDEFVRDLDFIISIASQFSGLTRSSESESDDKCNFYSKGDGNITVVSSTQNINQYHGAGASPTLSILVTNTLVFDNYLFLSNVNERVEKLDGAESRYTKETKEINWGVCDTSVK